MTKYLLIGPSGVGKSTVLNKLSKEERFQTYDLDSLISEGANNDLTHYTAEVGWVNFFNISKDIIESLISDKVIIVAVGAGSIEHPGGHSWFLEQNTIALTGDPRYIYGRSNRQMYHPEFNTYYATEFAPDRQRLYNNSKYRINVTGLNEAEVFDKVLFTIENAK